jgi:hypothetical protein
LSSGVAEFGVERVADLVGCGEGGNQRDGEGREESRRLGRTGEKVKSRFGGWSRRDARGRRRLFVK